MICSLCFKRDADKEVESYCDGAHPPSEKCEPRGERRVHWAPMCDRCLSTIADHSTPMHRGKPARRHIEQAEGRKTRPIWKSERPAAPTNEGESQ